MDDQLTLPLGEFVVPEPDVTLTLDERFDQWIGLNRWVADAVIAVLDDARAHGAERYGMKACVEVIRWRHMRATSGEPWRVNNSYTSRLARLVIEERPDLAPMLETRRLRTAA